MTRLDDCTAAEIANAMLGTVVAIREDFRDLARHAEQGMATADTLAERLRGAGARLEAARPSLATTPKGYTARLAARALELYEEVDGTWADVADTLTREGWTTPQSRPLNGNNLCKLVRRIQERS